MRSIVTGGAGFIGSNLVDGLLARGDDVAVIDNLSTGRRENLEQAVQGGAVLHEIDVRDAASVRQLFESFEPELVFHLAAQADVRVSVAQPIHDAEINICGTISLLEAARATGVSRLVNSSTGGGLYGDVDLIPTPEAGPICSLAPYGQSKLAAETYCELYRRLHGLSTISLRYGNVYGPRQDVHGEAGVVAIFCGCLVEQRRPTVYGDGRQTRDWVEVGDVVEANLTAAGAQLSGPVNVGHGRETSVLDLLAALDQASDRGPMPEPEFAPERLGEVQRSCLDVTRANQELGWHARTELADGLARTLATL
ncbi:MAG TPA: GDP-mannose 4,6-dehydratase [Solirubrobacteraceae bacterium]|jgi:UDP-glucose 4-epimerase